MKSRLISVEREIGEIELASAGCGLKIAGVKMPAAQLGIRVRRPAAKATPALALLLAVFVAGCSSFNRNWDRAAGQLPPANSIAGRWEGAWTSAVNGHTGRLRCLLTRASDTCYHAQFRATYWKVFRFSYAVSLAVEEGDGGWRLNGAEDLGTMAGGVYRYEGRVTPTNFHATYVSKYDHGVFELQRPE